MSLQSSGQTAGSSEPRSCRPKHQSGRSHRASGWSTSGYLRHSGRLKTSQVERETIGSTYQVEGHRLPYHRC